jgi:hypothetical protein
MGGVRELLCRHDYVAVEEARDRYGDFYVVRCEKWGKDQAGHPW